MMRRRRGSRSRWSAATPSRFRSRPTTASAGRTRGPCPNRASPRRSAGRCAEAMVVGARSDCEVDVLAARCVRGRFAHAGDDRADVVPRALSAGPRPADDVFDARGASRRRTFSRIRKPACRRGRRGPSRPSKSSTSHPPRSSIRSHARSCPSVYDEETKIIKNYMRAGDRLEASVHGRRAQGDAVPDRSAVQGRARTRRSRRLLLRRAEALRGPRSRIVRVEPRRPRCIHVEGFTPTRAAGRTTSQNLQSTPRGIGAGIAVIAIRGTGGGGRRRSWSGTVRSGDVRIGLADRT